MENTELDTFFILPSVFFNKHADYTRIIVHER